MRRLCAALALVLLLPASQALAHKVLASVFASGDHVEGEIGFSNGDMASNATVEVFDEEGNKLGEVTTDETGYFTYKPEKAVPLVFKSNLGAGHIAEVHMSADELPEIGGAAASPALAAAEAAAGEAASEAAGEDAGQAPAIDMTALIDAQHRMITEAVQKQVIPLRRDIDAYKEKHDMQSIIGGIGYIFGLFGLGFYVAARRKMKAA
ncbi:carboxypeptidase-like regulatory domain-containing protein [Afifella pfennigii]|uniref:carboxypeptidase-like regulatory domain-containing protein n=1 Tax=Afifella pfennigii TaxID=209897 RepID=UPI000479B8F6|nr:carboxypeptidase-like regulatory domain-containing protein [Afifella pfennigii]